MSSVVSQTASRVQIESGPWTAEQENKAVQRSKWLWRDQHLSPRSALETGRTRLTAASGGLPAGGGGNSTVLGELRDNTQQWSAPLSIPLSIWRSVITHCIWSATISHTLLWLPHRGQRMSFMITEPQPCIIWLGSQYYDTQSACCWVWLWIQRCVCVCMCRRVGVYLHASLCVWALTPASVSF